MWDLLKTQVTLDAITSLHSSNNFKARAFGNTTQNINPENWREGGMKDEKQKTNFLSFMILLKKWELYIWRINQPWIFIGKTDAEVEAPPDARSQLIGKDSDAGKDWRQKEKGVAEDEMVR